MHARALASMLAITASLVLPAGARAQQQAGSPTPAMLRADTAFRRADWKRAAELYAPIASADTSNAQAQFRLGSSLLESGQAAAAIVPLLRAERARLQPMMTQARLARAYAATQDMAQSFAHLERAATFGMSPTVLDTAQAFDAIRRAAGYAPVYQRIAAARYPCRADSNSHQLDFWVGDWDVTQWANPSQPAGTGGFNHVHPILEGCVVLEEWTSGNGGHGTSMNFWDANRLKWRQVWNDDGNGSLDYEGEYRDRAMRFEGWTRGAKGERVLQKLTFFNIAPDTVRQLFEQSADSGKTWQSTFDGRYVRRKAP
ncbi:MAG: tetratricopeptide repeat protein [Gemmatimonadetes bacterium]|nr:tetratricopeptide repeat protein [Gemmatimonadota bacterium]